MILQNITHLNKYPFLLLILGCIIFNINTQQDQIQKKTRIQREELNVRDSVALKYGSNTETLTFAVQHSMVDFALKPTQDEQIKSTLHTYWSQGNIYISSQYKEGENVQVLIYEDNTRIIKDFQFYMAYGFQFTANKGKTYTIRFIDNGKIGKLISMQISKLSASLHDRASKEHVQSFGYRLETFHQQLKALTGISQLAIVLHEKQSGEVNKSSCIYMTYLIIQAVIILIIVILQVKVMLKMLKSNIVV